MSMTAQRRYHDPEVIKEFAVKWGISCTFDYLYTLTVADICATTRIVEQLESNPRMAAL